MTLEKAFARSGELQMGLSRDHLKIAVLLAATRYEGEPRALDLGLFHVFANGYAVYVKHDRDAWNERQARSMLERYSDVCSFA